MGMRLEIGPGMGLRNRPDVRMGLGMGLRVGLGIRDGAGKRGMMLQMCMAQDLEMGVKGHWTGLHRGLNGDGNRTRAVNGWNRACD